MAQNGHCSFRYEREYCPRAQESAITTVNEGLYCYASTVHEKAALLRKMGSWLLSPFRHALCGAMGGPPAHRFLPKSPRQLPDNGQQQAPRKKRKKERNNPSQQYAARVPSSGEQVGQEGEGSRSGLSRETPQPETPLNSSTPVRPAPAARNAQSSELMRERFEFFQCSAVGKVFFTSFVDDVEGIKYGLLCTAAIISYPASSPLYQQHQNT